MALLLPGAGGDMVREAAWVARCVGRGTSAPLHPPDLAALSVELQSREFGRGAPVFSAGERSAGVWVVRRGLVELSARDGVRRTVVQLLHPGDVDGDLQLLLGMPMPYAARAGSDALLLFLPAHRFEVVLGEHPALTRRWLGSVAARLADSQRRLANLLGRPLAAQLAQVLLDEAVAGVVELPQATLAAMLGVRRPSLNRVLAGWADEGLVRVGYGRVELADPTGLARTARG
jgi:CRP-like cAMP-binding protein